MLVNKAWNAADAAKPNLASGKWVARETDFDDGLVTIGHFGDWRVGVETGIKGGNYRDWDGGSDEDHARLCATAPDLLDALREAIVWWDDRKPDYEPDGRDPIAPWRAAIAKALGK